MFTSRFTSLAGRLVSALIGLSAVSALAIAGPGPGSGPSAQKRCLSECRPRIGIVSAFGAEADILLQQTQQKREWKINGNRFTTGTLRGKQIVIVLSGVSMINGAMATQLMLDHFHIERLIMSGIAGGVNPARHVGDVLVPERWAMPMEVYWNGDKSIPAACGAPGAVACLGLQLSSVDGKFRPDFRMSTPNGPLSTGLFMRDNFVMTAANAPKGEYRFDYEADPAMLEVARSIKPVLLRCGQKDGTMCVSEQPQLRVGGRGISGTAFLANPEYRSYLYDTLQAEAVDMETAAFAHVAYSNGVPFIAFRGLSDLAGGHDFKDVGAFFGSGLAETNEASVTLAFLQAWNNKGARPR